MFFLFSGTKVVFVLRKSVRGVCDEFTYVMAVVNRVIKLDAVDSHGTIRIAAKPSLNRS